MSRFNIFLAAAGIMIIFAAQSWAASTCHDVHMEATNTAVDPMLMFGRYAGSALISIDGQPAMPAVISLTMAQVKIADDGTVHPTGILTLDLGQMGILSVQDNAVLSPTDNPYIYNMNTRFDNMTGTGMFTGAFGKFSGHGQFSFSTLTVSAQADGRICW